MPNLENGTFYYLVQGTISKEFACIEKLNKAIEKIKSRKRKPILPFSKLPIRVVVKKQTVSWFELNEWKNKREANCENCIYSYWSPPEEWNPPVGTWMCKKHSASTKQNHTCSDFKQEANKMKGSTAVIGYIISAIIVIILGYFTRDVAIEGLPAVILFGFVLIAFLIFMDMFAKLYACPVCNALGAINLTRWQKLVNSFSPGKLGEKCSFCNGRGIVDIRKRYLDSIKSVEGVEK